MGGGQTVKIKKIKLPDGNSMYILPNTKAVRKFLGTQIQPKPKAIPIKEWAKNLGLPFSSQ
jgi:hypothetical protein